MARRRQELGAKQSQQATPRAAEPAAKPEKPKPEKAKPSKPAPAGGVGWSLWTRLLVSLLVSGHMLAVFVAPWSLMTADALPPNFRLFDDQGNPVAPPPESSREWQKPIVVDWLSSKLTHYQNLVFINHGYEFFAPDPAGTHIMRYRVTRPDGQVVEGTFPDRKTHRPRLFYHRHMMLSEQTAGHGPSSGQNYADHLATVHGGESEVELVFHGLLPPYRVLEETPLDARSTYRVLASLQGKPRVAKTPPVELPPTQPQGAPR
ncbi:MAG: hypothetical protein AAGA92_15310 [Planctomycetota bacterium]